MKKTISAKIVADSNDKRGNRITTYLLQYPRFIHAEVKTHRLIKGEADESVLEVMEPLGVMNDPMLSRNAASSRAIPFAKMVQSVQEDPFIPIAWQKDHKGMQGTEYFETPEEIGHKKACWLFAADESVDHAIGMSGAGVTKQLCNRLLEPFQWMTVLVTATEYNNFFELRCPQYPGKDKTYRSKSDFFNAVQDVTEDSLVRVDGEPVNVVEMSDLEWVKFSKSHAEIHIQALAEAMWDARNESEPKTLNAGDWHIPFGDMMTGLDDYFGKLNSCAGVKEGEEETVLNEMRIQVATARCARLSYETHDGEIDYEKDIKLHDILLERKHASCFEHCAQVMGDDEYESLLTMSAPQHSRKGWCRNFRGFIPYRHLVNL